MININEMSCCAFQEIDGVEDYDDPKDFLLDLCREIWPERRVTYGEKNMPSAFYVFTGVIKVKRGNLSSTGMVERVAEYIKKHKLGALSKGPSRVNRINHPDHTVRGYIWAPSEDKLWKWWRANQDESDKENYKESLREARGDYAVGYGGYGGYPTYY